MPLTRRQAIAAGAALSATSAGAVAEDARNGPKPTGKIIDFRVRPPFRSFRNSASRAQHGADDEPLMARFLMDMEEANIAKAVAMGRTAPKPGPFQQFVANDDIAALITHYPDTFFGFGSVDVRDPVSAMKEVARCAGLGLRGIAFDNMLSDPPLHNDDASLIPIYEACVRHDMIIAINASGAMGPDMSYSDPVRVQKISQIFPEHPIVVTHGAWPYTREMVALAMYGMMLRNGNVYFQIDYALMADDPLPGASDYLDAINLTGMANGVHLHRKALFGSSFPAIDLSVATRRLKALELKVPGAREAVQWGNAATLLKIL